MGKKGANQETTKTKEKKKDKVIEDLTFGLKNKNKSKVVQNYCKEVTNRVKFSDVKGGAKAAEEAKRQDKDAKSKKQQQEDFIAGLFKAVTEVATTEEGTVDYKKTLCPYFKAGVCEKGKKCKYSHDMTVADTKASNIDIYTDPRQKLGTAPSDTIITCKDFIIAVENDKYGFNWTCPNGGDKCQYMHRLPQGYVLQKDQAPAEKDDDEMTLEEKIEEQRAALKYDECTRVTYETFMKWKEEKAKKKQEELIRKVEEEKASGNKKGGKAFGFMSGKALFTYDPTMFEDDEDAVDDDLYEEGSGSDEETKQAPAKKGGKTQLNQMQEAPEEESKEETKVDEALFEAENVDDEEDIDFD